MEDEESHSAAKVAKRLFDYFGDFVGQIVVSWLPGRFADCLLQREGCSEMMVGPNVVDCGSILGASQEQPMQGRLLAFVEAPAAAGSWESLDER